MNRNIIARMTPSGNQAARNFSAQNFTDTEFYRMKKEGFVRAYYLI